MTPTDPPAALAQPAHDSVDRAIVIGDSRADADAAALRDAVHEFNFVTTGYRDGRNLACFLHDNSGRLVAGIDGFTWGGYARIEYLWVDEGLRDRGIGARLLAAAEAEASARGCTNLVLDAHSFQAPDFYRARGYVEVGTTVDTPVGFTQTLFQKHLGVEPVPADGRRDAVSDAVSDERRARFYNDTEAVRAPRVRCDGRATPERVRG